MLIDSPGWLRFAGEAREPSFHCPRAGAVADRLPQEARLLEPLRRASRVAGGQRHVTERRERVRLELTRADGPAEREAFLEDGARFVRPGEPGQRGAKAVQDYHLVRHAAFLARERQGALVMFQRRLVAAALPFEDAERIANRSLASAVANGGRERQRRFERRNGVAASFAQRACEPFARL